MDEVYSPNAKHAGEFAKKFNCNSVNLEKVGLTSDLIILAVPDSKIAEVAKNLQNRSGTVVHTSGNTPMSTLANFECHGVFYPLQTFTKNQEVAFAEVPICIEASTKEVLNRLLELAKKLSPLVYQINSQQRKNLHVAAVTVNNFTNYLYGLAAEFLEDHSLDFDLLKPLILETAKKITSISPNQAQTGPAKRGDLSTIEQQLKLLENKPELQILYQLFSEQLMKKYNE